MADTNVGKQGELERRSGRGSIERGHHRDLQGSHRLVEAAEGINPCLRGIRAEIDKFIEILAGAEGPFARACDNHGPDVSFARAQIQRADQFIAHGHGPGVQDLWPVERDQGDRWPAFKANGVKRRFVSHRRSIHPR